MVGAVLVHNDRIIGEGWHKKYGEAHAEVNSINSVKNEDKQFIHQSTLYVSLEPCAHFGKTPPCTDLIVKNEIPKVVIGCKDPFQKEKGIEKLKEAGVEVEVGILENECKELNKRFFTFHTAHRPYIILKWAQTKDGKIAAPWPPLTPTTGENSAQTSLAQSSYQVIENSEFYAEADPATYKILKEFVTAHRKKPTEAENVLWNYLRGNKLKRYAFRRQHIIGNFIIDFVCLAKKLIIEVDGSVHQLPDNKISDEQRTLWLNDKGYTVMRLTNNEVLRDIKSALLKIEQKLEEPPYAEKKIYSRKASPVGGGLVGARLLISNEFTNRLVHKWRSEEASILVGTNTALMDDPELTNRHWNGPSPIRLVVDMDLSLPNNLKLFNGQQPTIVFNTIKHDLHEEAFTSPVPTLSGRPLQRGIDTPGVGFYQVTQDVSLVHQIVNALYQLKIQSVLVEGGAKLLQSFIDEGMWDEIRKIQNLPVRQAGSKSKIEKGLAAPQFENALKIEEQNILSDKIEIYRKQ